MTIREFSEIQHVSYEAIRKKIKRYEKELKGHILKKGRTQYLDDYAIEFLKEHIQEKQVITYAADMTEQVQALQQENKLLLIKIGELQDQLLKEKDQVKLLQQEKIDLLENQKPEKRRWWQHIKGSGA